MGWFNTGRVICYAGCGYTGLAQMLQPLLLTLLQPQLTVLLVDKSVSTLPSTLILPRTAALRTLVPLLLQHPQYVQGITYQKEQLALQTLLGALVLVHLACPV